MFPSMESPVKSEFWVIVGTGVAIVGVLVAVWLDLRADNRAMDARLDGAVMAIGDNAKAIGDNANAIGSLRADLGRIEGEIKAARADLGKDLSDLQASLLRRDYRHLEIVGIIGGCLYVPTFAEFKLCVADARGMLPQGQEQ